MEESGVDIDVARNECADAALELHRVYAMAPCYVDPEFWVGYLVPLCALHLVLVCRDVYLIPSMDWGPVVCWALGDDSARGVAISRAVPRGGGAWRALGRQCWALRRWCWASGRRCWVPGRQCGGRVACRVHTKSFGGGRLWHVLKSTSGGGRCRVVMRPISGAEAFRKGADCISMELAVFRAPSDGRGIGGGDIVGGLGGLRPDGARIFVISKEGVQVQVGRGGVSRPQVGSHSELPDAFRERV